MKTTPFILTALAHLSQSELLLVTYFYFQFALFFDCKIRHSFEFMCVLINKPAVFSMARLSPLCGCRWMCLSFRVERMANKK